MKGAASQSRCGASEKEKKQSALSSRASCPLPTSPTKMSDDTSPFAKLSQEVTEAILEATLDRTPSLNLKQLLKAQLVS